MRAIKTEVVSQMSSELPKILADEMNTSEDNFTFEAVSTQFFAKGKPDASYPFIEVLWFARSQEVQNRCAEIITAKVKEAMKCDDVVVVFQVLEKTAYYENGTHF
ncbi:pseudouridine synthase [Bdellovibrio bacteriovorus]|uniref:Pseudouridine synthase n=3 Tax=Bdellovibrio bacteriovorus TaxID=959 RepID=A0A150WLF1_BDEBC|nr:pseudouridine synthase [Bdellovibrio bacteriovorus]